MDAKTPPPAREKILAAAAAMAREVGPAHLTLDAVAARANVSKGGLLYHFHSKLDLLKALVESHLDRFGNELARKERSSVDGTDSVLRCYVEMFVAESEARQPPPTGVLAAMVQNPELLEPIRRFKRDILDRIVANACDEPRALVVFLALEGLRSLKLCGTDILSDAESEQAVAALLAMISKADRAAASA